MLYYIIYTVKSRYPRLSIKNPAKSNILQMLVWFCMNVNLRLILTNSISLHIYSVP